MQDGWSEIGDEKARALAKARGLKGVTWSTLDERYYFEDYEWADEAQTRYAFPGTTHVLVANFYEGCEPDKIRWRVKDAWLATENTIEGPTRETVKEGARWPG